MPFRSWHIKKKTLCALQTVGLLHSVLIPLIVDSDTEAFLPFSFSSLSTFFHKSTLDTIKHATWIQSVVGRVSYDRWPCGHTKPNQGHVDASSKVSKGCCKLGDLQHQVTLTPCQMSRMDPKAQNMLWTAMDGNFHSTLFLFPQAEGREI